MKPKASRLLAASQIVLCLTALPSLAADYDWDGLSGGDWDLNTNWSADILPGTLDNVFINVPGAAEKTITLSATPTFDTINEVGLNRSGDGVATVNHTGGTLNVNSWFNLGQGGGGTGIWNMSGLAQVNANHSVGGLTVIGVNGGSTGILNIAGDAWFNQTANAIHVGGEGSGNTAKGIVNLSGNGKLSNTSSLLVGVAANGSTGVVNVADNATLTADVILLGTNNGATGAINQSGGTVSTTTLGPNSLSLGNVTGGFGSYRISGGSLTSSEIGVGAIGGGSGMLDISGGSVTNNGWLVVNRTEGAGSVSQNAVINVSGGSLTYNGSGLVTNWGSSETEAQFSAITVSGSGSISTGNDTAVRLGWGNSANNFSVLNLNGGTVTPSRVFGNQSYVNFNGGTLRANSDQGDFLAVTNAQVRSGGAIIDSNGHNITINQALLAPTDNGVTTIAVADGGSGYISAPILKISGGTGSGATAIANMVDDGSGNGTFRIGSITITGAGNYTVAPDSITQIGGAPTAAATFGSITTAANTSGGLTKNGAGTLTLTGDNTFTGAVVVNGGELYVNRPNLPTNPMGLVSSITINDGATLRATTNGLFGYGNSPQAPITVNSGGMLTMNDGADLNVGNITLAGGELAAIGTNHAAWGSYVFRYNNSVLSVTENSTVSAPNVLMQNGSSIDVAAGKNLNFTGTLTNGTAGGPGTLIKTGDGTITLTNTNTHTGGTTVSAGIVSITGTNSLPGWDTNGSYSVASGATLAVGNAVTDGNIATMLGTTNFAAGAAIGFDTSAGDRIYSTTLTNTAQGALGVTKIGANVLTLSGDNNYTGATRVQAGTLVLSGTNTGSALQVNGDTALVRITGGATTVPSVWNDTHIVGGGTVEIDGGSMTITGGGAWFSVGNHPTLPAGDGTLTLTSGSFTNNNSWGIVVGGGSAGVGVVNINGGTFTADDGLQFGLTLGESAGGNGTLNLNGGVLITDQIRGGAGVGTVNFNGGKLQATGGSADVFANNANITTTILAGGLTVGGTPDFAMSEAMGGTGGLTKVDANTVTLSGTNSYSGATLVSAGTLFVNGELGNTAVTVGPDGTIGGSGSIAGSLNFDDGAKLTVNLADPLSISGLVTFANFGFDDLIGFDVQSVAEGTYTLLAGSNFNFTNVANFGEGNALVRDDGKLAYFQSGSLQVVVIPEPRAALLGSLGLLALLRRRRD